MGLNNVAVHQDRVEQHEPEFLYDVVISRAFTDLLEFSSLSQRLLNSGGKLLAMKRGKPKNELDLLDRQSIPHEFHYLCVLNDRQAASVIEINR